MQCITSVLMGASHHLKMSHSPPVRTRLTHGQTGRPQGSPLHFKMSHSPPVRTRLTQVRFLPAVVRFRLHDEPGLGPLRQWGQEDTCQEESQEEERLRQVERRFAMSEPVENFEEMGHLGHLGHLRH